MDTRVDDVLRTVTVSVWDPNEDQEKDNEPDSLSHKVWYSHRQPRPTWLSRYDDRRKSSDPIHPTQT